MGRLDRNGLIQNSTQNSVKQKESSHISGRVLNKPMNHEGNFQFLTITIIQNIVSLFYITLTITNNN